MATETQRIPGPQDHIGLLERLEREQRGPDGRGVVTDRLVLAADWAQEAVHYMARSAAGREAGYTDGHRAYRNEALRCLEMALGLAREESVV